MLHHSTEALSRDAAIRELMMNSWNQSFSNGTDGSFLYIGSARSKGAPEWAQFWLSRAPEYQGFWLLRVDADGNAEAWTSDESTEITEKLAELHPLIDTGWDQHAARPATRQLTINELWEDFGACLPGLLMAQRLLGKRFDLDERTIARAVIGGLPVGFLIDRVINRVPENDYPAAYADIGKMVILGALRSVELISSHRFGHGTIDKLIAYMSSGDYNDYKFTDDINDLIAQITPERGATIDEEDDRDYGIISSLASIARAVAWQDDRDILTNDLATAVSRGIACVYARGDLEAANSPHIVPFIHALMDIAEKYEVGTPIPS